MSVSIRRIRDEHELDAAVAVRHEVFIVEQGVSVEGELDGRDHEATHLIAVDEDTGQVLGTCRLIVERGLAKFGRLAVLREARGRSIGAALLAEAEREARSAGAERMGLHAQLTARGLYDRAGFQARGDVFLDEGIEHIAMFKSLT